MATHESPVIDVPAPTAWPLVLAMGITMVFAGLLTHVSVTGLGVVLSLAGCVGWCREIISGLREVPVPVAVDDGIAITTDRRVVDRLPIAPEQLRAWLPVRTYPVSAGVRGGWAGGVAMAVLACGYGALKAGSIWYPINLLAAVVHSQSVRLESSDPSGFNADSFMVALGLHALVSTLVGLLYGAMLPMIPRRPMILGGVVVPILWSGLLFPAMQILNPLLASRIDWSWFVASQVAFGVVAGAVVVRYSPRRTSENVSFALRAGIEAPGTMRGETRP